MPKTTIVEVAKRAGVSLTTVSRVLNGNYPVKEATAERVRSAIRELQYEPNAVARSMKSNRTWLIGMVVPDISNPFFTQMVKGVERATEKLGYSILVVSTYERPEKEHSIIRLLAQRRVDALILSTCQTDPEVLCQSTAGIPTVLVDRRLPESSHDLVVEDNRSSSARIVEHLLENGHRDIAVVNGNLSISIARERYEGYVQAMASYGLQPQPQYVLDCSITKLKTVSAVEEVIYQAFRQHLPTAVFSTSNTRTQAVLGACRRLGLSVPQDISLVSYGEVPNLFTSLRITHVAQDAALMGRKAAEGALRLLDSPAPHSVRENLLTSPIIYGNSVERPRSTLNKEGAL